MASALNSNQHSRVQSWLKFCDRRIQHARVHESDTTTAKLITKRKIEFVFIVFFLTAKLFLSAVLFICS